MTDPQRRQHGTGGIRFDPDKDRWIGTIEAGQTARGTRRRIKVTGRTEAEVKTKLKERARQIAAEGLPVEGASTRTTVAIWSKTWVERRAAEVRHNTAATDASMVRRWIVPTIGTKKLEQLTPADVRAVTSAVTTAGRSTTTANYAQGTLLRLLRAAILEGYQVPQRVLLTPAPSKATNDRDAISMIDAHAMLAQAAALPDGSRWVAAFLQGMRQGECLGLTWDDVDLKAGTITIAWQLDALPYNAPHDRTSGFRIKPGLPHKQLVDRWHLVPVKTKRGERVIPLVPWMSAALTAWREVAPTNRWNLVWPSPDGAPRDDVDDRRAWFALQDAAQVARTEQAPAQPGDPADLVRLVGRRYKLHEARHTTATLLLEAGVSETVIIAIMGHSSIVTSRGYMHLSQALARRALDDVAERLGLTAS